MKTELFQKEVNQLINDLKQKHIDLGMKASGRWLDELEAIFEISENSFVGKIVGAKYTKQLTQGREPGSFPPVQAIKDWIINKPITPTDNISIDSLAFLIGRKIQEVGTNYFQQGGTDLIDSVITQDRLKSIVEKLGLSLLDTATLEINEEIKRLAE